LRPIRTVMTTLLVTGLASLGYARSPAPVAAQPFSALAAATPSQQDEQKPKDKTESKPADTGKQEKPARTQTPDKPQTPDTGKQEKPAKTQAPDQSQKKAQAQEDKNQKQDQNLAKQDQAADKGREGSGGRIPDKDYKAHFGQEHKFSARQVVTTTTIVPNQTRFVYTGYTFVFVDPWPAEWAMDDDCYIDYIDGEYYLLDLDHPGVQIELAIVG
jgi:DNA mismatch repair ATPase MutL